MNTPDVLACVLKALNGSGIASMLVGSFSSNLYGIPRMTHDADFVLQSDVSFENIVAALGAEFEIDPQRSFETVTSTLRHIAIHKGTRFKI